MKWLADNITIVSTNIEIEVRHITWVDHDIGTTYVPEVSPSLRLSSMQSSADVCFDYDRGLH